MLKKLKSLFVVEDENAKKTEQSSSAPTSKAKSTPSSTAKKTSTSTKSSGTPTDIPVNKSAKPTKKFVDVLLKAIDANNLEGFDYLEFKQSLQSLSKMDMDEATRYKSALAMAKTMGATRAKLKKSAQHYVNVLKKEEAKFMDAVKNQNTVQVTDREKRLGQLSQLIKEKEQKIVQLQKEIVAHKKELETAKGKINQAAAKVAATRDGFIAAYNSVQGQIMSDMAKMDKHLK
jgi:vacuolar-type H+-ATPase subunit I/STV1